ncbi:hypothetical protein [Sedimentitalea arenosa]|uniref:hypothetical protein n=1 Tax=Sedimentitalea arenosa TaxID=2798803 RepID=UPI0018EA99B2|nr:hypothetical protein [Arenibacterium arenosum]
MLWQLGCCTAGLPPARGQEPGQSPWHATVEFHNGGSLLEGIFPIGQDLARGRLLLRQLRHLRQMPGWVGWVAFLFVSWIFGGVDFDHVFKARPDARLVSEGHDVDPAHTTRQYVLLTEPSINCLPASRASQPCSSSF